jgi:hypothetical protein
LIPGEASQRTSRIVGTVVGVIFLFSILDTFLSGYLEPKATYRAFPGTSQFITGELQDPVESTVDIGYSAEPPVVRLAFLEARGRLWRGSLDVDAAAPEGEIVVKVFRKRLVPDDGTPRFKVLVFTDGASYRASFKSLTRRFLGIPPWWISLITFPLVGLSLALSYYFSGKREAILATQGIMPITRMVRSKSEWEVTFALGLDHGIKMGDRLHLLNDKLERTGEVVVTHTEADESKASLDASAKIGPNSFVAKP